MSRADPPVPVQAVSPILIATGGVALLCIMDATMKHVVALTHPLTATFGRSVLSVLLGVYIAAFPGLGLLGLIWTMGVYAILFGIALIALSVRLRRLAPTLRGVGPTLASPDA